MVAADLSDNVGGAAKDLRTYCELDTYAMFQILRHLHDLVGRS
jgi:hypothetical protein